MNRFNKASLLIGGIALLVGLFLYAEQQIFPGKSEIPPVMQKQEIPLVTLTINNGDTIATYSGVRSATPFDSLTSVTSENNIVIETKQYDFGVMVESIDNKRNSNEKAWIYFINGTAGQEAANKAVLYDGDVVEWKYIPPTM